MVTYSAEDLNTLCRLYPWSSSHCGNSGQKLCSRRRERVRQPWLPGSQLVGQPLFMSSYYLLQPYVNHCHRNEIMHVCMLSHLVVPNYFVTSWSAVHQALHHKILQTRILEQIACPLQRIFPTQGSNLGSFATCTTWKFFEIINLMIRKLQVSTRECNRRIFPQQKT